MGTDTTVNCGNIEAGYGGSACNAEDIVFCKLFRGDGVSGSSKSALM